VLLLLLSCGHVSLHLGENVPASKANEWLWTCIECEAEEQEATDVIATMTGDELESVTEEQFEVLVERASTAENAQ